MTIFTPTAAGVQLTNINASASVALGVGSGVTHVAAVAVGGASVGKIHFIIGKGG